MTGRAPLAAEPDRLRVVAAPSLREQVADTLRRAIASGALAPGERLVERNVCERLGVSRTSLREALRELENDGLLTNLRHRGLIVAGLSVKEARDVFDVRAAMEALICRLFCERATPDQRAACRAAFAAVQGAYEGADPAAMLAAKSDLYDTLMDGADNPIAARTLRSVHIRVSQLRTVTLSSPPRRAASLREMEALVDSLERGDAAAAERLSLAHVRAAAEAALKALEAAEAAP